LDLFKLRWRLVWHNGLTKCGAWSDPGAKDDPWTKASSFSSSGLSLANIEAQHITSRKIMVLASIEGADYCCFQWLGTVTIDQTIINQKLIPKIQGLSIVGRNHVATVLKSGLVQMELKSFEDKTMQYGKV